MKKRLNILCTVLMIILFAEVGYMAGVFCRGVVDGYTTAMKAPKGQEFTAGETHTISVFPSETSHANSFKGTDKKTGKTYEIWPQTFQIQGSLQEGSGLQALKMLGELAVFAGVIIALVTFIRFVIGVNRNEVFSPKAVKRLRTMGWMFLLVAAGNIITNLITVQAVKEHFLPDGYYIQYSQVIPFDALIFALFTFIIAEAFTIGIRMKEEQELTI